MVQEAIQDGGDSIRGVVVVRDGRRGMATPSASNGHDLEVVE